MNNADLTAVRILLEGKPGAAQNVVREDYRELAALIDKLNPPRVEKVQYAQALYLLLACYFVQGRLGYEQGMTDVERHDKVYNFLTSVDLNPWSPAARNFIHIFEKFKDVPASQRIPKELQEPHTS